MPTVEDIKFWISSAFFFGVAYPLKKVIIPILLIIREQVYLYLSILTGFVLIYLYDYNIDKIITDFITKMSVEDSWFIQWLFTPLLFKEMLTCPFILCLFITIACSFVNLGYGWIRMFKIATRVLADAILAVLYVYYVVTGNKESSTICSSGHDEQRTKIIVYFLVGIFAIAVIVFVVLTMKTELQTTVTSTQVILNASFPNETANVTRISLDFIPDLPYQNILGVIP